MATAGDVFSGGVMLQTSSGVLLNIRQAQNPPPLQRGTIQSQIFIVAEAEKPYFI